MATFIENLDNQYIYYLLLYLTISVFDLEV